MNKCKKKKQPKGVKLTVEEANKKPKKKKNC